MKHIGSNQDQHSYTDFQDVAATLAVTKDARYSENFVTKGDFTRYTALMIGIGMAVFMMSLNSTVVPPAMGIIATELNATQYQTWIATAYLVALNAFQPLSGKFSDIFGRKTIFLFGIILFFVGSLVNALSTNINMLIVGRTIQGFGGGGVMSMAYIVVTEVTPIVLRPRFQSFLVVVYGLTSVVGPLIGGAFVDHVSWHWDFWLNVILAAVSFVIILVFLKSPQNDKKTSFTDKLKRIDWLGTLFVTGFVVCLLLALSWGSSYGWGSEHTIGSFVASGVSLIALIFVEGWVAKEPLLPARVILNPICTFVYLYMICLGLTFVCALYFGPTYFQAVFGANSTQSGIRLVPFMVCLIVGSITSGLLVRVFPYTKYYIVTAAVSNILCYGLYYTINENSNLGQQAGYLTFGGLAVGLSTQNAILTVQSSVERKDIAVATSCVTFFLMLASSTGVSIYQALMSTFLKAEFAHLSTDIILKANEYGGLKNYLYIRNMPADLQKPVIHAFALAMRNLFIIPLIFASLSLIFALSFKNVRYGPSKSSSSNKEKLNEKEVV